LRRRSAHALEDLLDDSLGRLTCPPMALAIGNDRKQNWLPIRRAGGFHPHSILLDGLPPTPEGLL
jgi:hypothetical protein